MLYVGPCFHGCHWHREKPAVLLRSTVWSLLFLGGRSAVEKGELELLIGFPRTQGLIFFLSSLLHMAVFPSQLSGEFLKTQVSLCGIN